MWQDLEACPAERVVVSDTPKPFVHEGWPIYAGPDLVYCPDDTARRHPGLEDE